MRIPRDRADLTLVIEGKKVALSNLDKPFWPELGLTKRDLLQYYADVAPLLLPHIRDRPMVMKRYPNGAAGDHFFMKRTPTPRPDWLRTCAVAHSPRDVIHYPLIDDLAALLWVVNLGCIDLNPFYARCDDVDRPDVLHLDLDPGGARFEDVRATAFLVRDALAGVGMRPLVKTTGSKGLHVYVPIVRGPTQREVWTFAKALALLLAGQHPELATAEYKVARRPAGRVLLDYNQNSWGRTLASIYSVRPTPIASVSTPISWRELERGARNEDFTVANVRARLARKGDLWAPLLAEDGRTDLAALTGQLLSGRELPSSRSRPGAGAAAPARRSAPPSASGQLTGGRGSPARATGSPRRARTARRGGRARRSARPR